MVTVWILPPTHLPVFDKHKKWKRSVLKCIENALVVYLKALVVYLKANNVTSMKLSVL